MGEKLSRDRVKQASGKRGREGGREGGGTWGRLGGKEEDRQMSFIASGAPLTRRRKGPGDRPRWGATRT